MLPTFREYMSLGGFLCALRAQGLEMYIFEYINLYSSLCFPSNDIHNIHMKIESSDGWTIRWSDDWSLSQEPIWWFVWKSDGFARIWWIIRWLKKIRKSDDCAIWQSKHLINEALMTEAWDYWSIRWMKHPTIEASDGWSIWLLLLWLLKSNHQRFRTCAEMSQDLLRFHKIY